MTARPPDESLPKDARCGPLIGWCDEHESMAELYDDGSVGCHYLFVVETTSDYCRVVPIPHELLYIGIAP